MTTLIPLLLSLILGLEAQIATIETAQASSPPPVVQPVILTVEEKIRVKALEHGLDPDLMVRIARAESSLNPLAKNSGSSASGIYQIINGTWKYFECTGDVFNEDDNINCAMKIMKDGVHHWNASKQNWSK